MRSGRSPAKRILNDNYKFQIGKGIVIQEGSDVSIIACGVQVARALDAARELQISGISAEVINMSTIKPIDSDIILQSSKKTGCIVTAEDHNIFGGLGSAVAESTVKNNPVPIEFVGIQDVFGESGEPEELANKFHLTGSYIAKAAMRAISRKI